MLKSQCPNCKMQFEIDERFLGKRVRCKSCQEAFRITDSNSPSQAADREDGKHRNEQLQPTAPGSRRANTEMDPAKRQQYREMVDRHEQTATKKTPAFVNPLDGEVDFSGISYVGLLLIIYGLSSLFLPFFGLQWKLLILADSPVWGILMAGCGVLTISADVVIQTAWKPFLTFGLAGMGLLMGIIGAVYESNDKQAVRPEYDYMKMSKEERQQKSDAIMTERREQKTREQRKLHRANVISRLMRLERQTDSKSLVQRQQLAMTLSHLEKFDLESDESVIDVMEFKKPIAASDSRKYWHPELEPVTGLVIAFNSIGPDNGAPLFQDLTVPGGTMARDGFAFGGVNIRAKNISTVWTVLAIQPIFMKRDGDRLETTNSYTADWIGKTTSGSGEIRDFSLESDGRIVCGITLSRGFVGLILKRNESN